MITVKITEISLSREDSYKRDSYTETGLHLVANMDCDFKTLFLITDELAIWLRDMDKISPPSTLGFVSPSETGDIAAEPDPTNHFKPIPGPVEIHYDDRQECIAIDGKIYVPFKEDGNIPESTLLKLLAIAQNPELAKELSK